MIKQYDGNTADEIWRMATEDLRRGSDCLRLESRLGPIREYLHCSLHLQDPLQRWVLSRRPALNPAFAIAELIWILQGRDDAGFPNYWNPALPKFAGTGNSYYGAYGQRLRKNLGFDQIERAYEVLAANPNSRQVVLQIWDGNRDLPQSSGDARSADIPCNIVAMPKIRHGRLEWTQVMRSNDLFLGTPHNFIQFTSLQEIMAGWLGINVGSFVLISDSLHLYEHDAEKLKVTENAPPQRNTDSLALRKEEFDEVLPIVANAMDELRSETLSRSHFKNLIRRFELPESWHNLLCIAAADAARRRNWDEERELAANHSTNPALNAAWDFWMERCMSN